MRFAGRHRISVNRPGQQFHWALLLLVVAIVLPTVCLLWFMGQAVGNERLVVRQKLIDSYRIVLSDQLEVVDQKWSAAVAQAEALLGPSPRVVLDGLVSSNLSDGLLVCDNAGQCVYPVLIADQEPVDTSGLSPAFLRASQLEFVRGDLEQAIVEYERIADEAGSVDRLRATAAIVRCLNKAGRLSDAVAVTKSALEGGAPDASVESARMLFNLRLGFVRLLQREQDDTADELVNLLEWISDSEHFGELFPTEVRLTFLQRTISLVDPLPDDADLQRWRTYLHNLSDALDRSLLAVQPKGLSTDSQSLMGVADVPSLFSYALSADGHQHILLFERERIGRIFNEAFSERADPDLCVRVFDADGRAVFSTGESDCAELFSLPAGNRFPGWTVSLYPSTDGIFDVAASRQATLYLWTGTLVILLFLAAGSTVAVMVVRQVRLNRLKNDFIATVSHELKTPLASMRVLMDTLFEGHYEISPRVMNYLGMISQDNLRLARLIDNFLTFSRMERDKQAFTITGTEAGPIVQEAVKALNTKFTQEDCHFSLVVPDDLPPVLADHDALVTVLINLLENAFKYSNAPREISLTVSCEDDALLYVVKDNGIGMSPRAVRRIFDKFYQVDQRLTRKADGCGLGLSIVKFIVDAHGGSIQVASILNEGSTFTVRIPRAS